MAAIAAQLGAIPRSLTAEEVDGQATRALATNIGLIYYVDAVNGLDSNDGRSLAFPFKTLTVALAIMRINDTLFVARGGYTGDFFTGLNAVSPFINIIGMNATGVGFGAFLASTTTSEPTISVRARGVRISGLEFDNPVLDAGIELLKNAGGTQRPDFLEVDHCLFTGGKFGIDVNGGATYGRIHHNLFDYLSVSGGSAISATSTSQQLPGRWKVWDNEFLENVNHMDMGVTVGNHGFNSSVIGPDNVFQHKGQARDVTVALDIRGGKGNLLVGNYVGANKSATTTGTVYEIGNDDRSAGNHMLDGEQAADFAST